MLSFCFAQSHCKALYHKMVHCKTTQSRQNRPSPLTAHLQWRHQKNKNGSKNGVTVFFIKKCISNQSTHGLTYQKALHQKIQTIHDNHVSTSKKVRHHNRNRSFQKCLFSVYTILHLQSGYRIQIQIVIYILSLIHFVPKQISQHGMIEAEAPTAFSFSSSTLICFL